MFMKILKNKLSALRVYHGLTVLAAVALMAVGLWLFAHRYDGELKQGVEALIQKRDGFASVNYKLLHTFYTERHHRPVWVNGHGPNRAARELRNAIDHADREALMPRDYHAAQIESYWDSNRLQDLARLEVLLSDAFMRYGVEVKVGYQFPRSVDPDWHITPDRVDPVALLEESIDDGHIGKILADLPPPHTAYRNLRAGLQMYRDLARAGEWPQIKVEKDVKPGNPFQDAAKLRERLARESYIAASQKASAAVYSEFLVDGVRAFQSRHGLPATGVLDRSTARALNKPISERIAEIEKNMERWRWLPRELPDRYIAVNIADYKLTMYEDHAPAMDMKVIIGKKYRATPVIASNIEYVDFNPTWSVPERIAREDMLPKIRDDLYFFDRQGIRVWSKRGKQLVRVDPTKVRWDEIDPKRFPFYLQQDAGDENSLGRIKFGLRNAYDIYLHDTPHRELFSKDVRAFSSGCIRLEQPERLAAKVLQGSRWTEDRIENTLEKNVTVRVALPKRLPVYIWYLTAWSADGKTLEFRDDVYIRDRALPDNLQLTAVGRPSKFATAGI